MSERKVLNKYYPPDFDPSKIPRLHLPKDRQYTVRLMAPCNMKCRTCGEYIYKGKKFNARKETVQGEDYLGLKIFRFYIKCTRCLAEITFKTDPQNADYIVEHGATRNFQALKLAEEQAEREQRDREEEEASNPMKLLENRTKASKLEMDVMESLEELRELQERHANVDYENMLNRHADHTELLKKRQEEEDEAVVRSIFGKDDSDVVVKRILDDDEDSDDDTLRVHLKNEASLLTGKPSDILTDPTDSLSNQQIKSWEKSVGALTTKSTLLGLVRPKCQKGDGIPKSSEMTKPSQLSEDSSAVGQSQVTSDHSMPSGLGMIGTYSESSSEGTESESEKAANYLSWEDYFMALACLAAQRSKDPNTKVGACIVNRERRVVALGYNGMPNGCDDDMMPWGREGNWEETKFPFVCHAEMNAIMNKTASDLKDCTIYSTLFPCNECAKLIIQAGIKNVLFLSDKHHSRPSTITARRLFDTAGISYRQLLPKHNVVIDFKLMAKDCANSNDSNVELLSSIDALELL